MPTEKSAMCIDPPLPWHEPGRAPEQLGHHRLDRDALGDRVAVAAVGRGDPVGRTQRGARPDGDSLLPDRGVGGAPDAAHLDHQRHERVELADADHAPIEVDGVGRRQRREGLVGQRRVPWRAVIVRAVRPGIVARTASRGPASRVPGPDRGDAGDMWQASSLGFVGRLRAGPPGDILRFTNRRTIIRNGRG